MPRVFCYSRVSSADQSIENQMLEIRAAGFSPDPRRSVTESISGGVAASQRKKFVKLKHQLKASDILVVTKLDRLGRNAMDVRATVDALAVIGVKVHCLALGGVDLTSAAGKVTMRVLNAVAEFERDLLIERTNSGIAGAKAEGKHMGRKPSLAEADRHAVLSKLAAGESVSALSRQFTTTRQTIMRIRRSAQRQQLLRKPSARLAEATQ